MDVKSQAYEQGLAIRKATLGAEYVEQALSQQNEFTKDLQTLVTSYCWGEIWARPGLGRKTRSIINIAMLSALNRPHELALHIKGARNNGVSQDEIKEVLLQVGIYCGVPAMVDSFRIARTALEQLEGAGPANA